MNKIKAGEKKVIPFSVFISKHCNWVVRRDKFGWTTNIPEWDGIYTTEELYDIFVNYEQQPSTGMREALEEVRNFLWAMTSPNIPLSDYAKKEASDLYNKLKALSALPENECKWSDSDVKKFLEDYRVANMDCYLNPVIWFDKLNEKK